MNETLRKTLRWLGSAEFTSGLIVLCAVVALAGVYTPIRTSDWITIPAALLLVNLLAAMATNARLKSQSLLYAFHAALAAMIAIIALDRANSMSGHVEVTEGAMFDAGAVEAEAGFLHEWRLDQVKFLQGPFEINYAPRMNRRDTVSIVRIPEYGGRWREERIGDDTPLIFGDYRFYTTHNKGFAPIVTYLGASGRAQTGSIHLPSYPINENRQGQEWTPPGAEKPLKVWLHIPEPVFEENKAWRFDKPANTRLVVIEGENRHELQIGQSIKIGSAQLRYDGVRTWMGYSIVGQSLTHWIAAAGVMACLALLAHVVSLLFDGSRRPAAEAGHGG